VNVSVSSAQARSDLMLLKAGIHQAAALALKAGIAAAVASAKGTTTWKDQTGATRASIRGESFAGRGFVEAGGASRFLEYGTRPHIIRARRAQALRFVVSGVVLFRKWVRHPGTRPTHFLTEARHRGEQAFEWGAEVYVAEAIQRV